MQTAVAERSQQRALPPREEVDRVLAERYLDHFIEQAWHVIEPATPYIPNWHIDAICEHLEAVTRREIKRLIINIPPRHMKSIAVAVMWPAWVWINNPYHKWLFSSYAEQLSVRDSVKCRRLVQSNWYQRRWGKKFKLAGDQNQKTRFENDKYGYRLATSVDGAATGEGGDVVVIDDPHNVKETQSIVKLENVRMWWDEVMPTRINDPKTGAFVIIMQRCHENDLTGHILAKEMGYTHLCLPARYEGNRCKTIIPIGNPFKDSRTVAETPLWPDRFGDAELKELEKGMTSYAVAGQLQQRPAPREGGYLKRDWFKIVKKVPDEVKKRLRYWDLAATEDVGNNDPDYTAGARISRRIEKSGEDIICIEHMYRMRKTPLKVEDTIKDASVMDGPGCVIHMEQEPGASGKAVCHHYAKRVLTGFTFRAHKVTGSKESYVDAFAAAAENGRVEIVDGPWVQAFLSECELFPVGAHDDMVDVAAKGYHKIMEAGLAMRSV